MENSSKRVPVQIAGIEIQKIEYRGQQVVTFTMIDKVHGRVDGTARRTFNENKSRFIKQDDFYILDQPNEIRTLGFTRPQGGVSASVVLITRRGYLKITKSLNDDAAWAVFDEMLERYFAVEQVVAQAKPLTTTETLIQMLQLQAEVERRQDEQGRAIASLESKVALVESTQLLTSRPANSESIVHIRQRIGRLFGLSADVIDYVLRQSPYAPKPAGNVRNDHASADGATYTIWWQKDVTAVFNRFVGECQPATQFMHTHPFIEGRFRVAKKAVVA